MPINDNLLRNQHFYVWKENLNRFFVESECNYVCFDLKNFISQLLPRGKLKFHSNFHINNNIDRFVEYCKSKNIMLLIFISSSTINWKKKTRRRYFK